MLFVDVRFCALLAGIVFLAQPFRKDRAKASGVTCHSLVSPTALGPRIAPSLLLARISPAAASLAVFAQIGPDWFRAAPGWGCRRGADGLLD